MPARREVTIPVDLHLTPEGGDWRTEGACAGSVDDWLWFDHTSREEPEALVQARAICGGCPVKAECLEYALGQGEQGIWAGTTWAERGRIARNRNRQSRAKEATA